jgi:hypothetical protein
MKSFLLGLLVLIAAGSAGIAQTPLAPATQRPTSLAIDSGVKTATATAGAATLNKGAGVITSEALTTAAGATYTLTLTNSAIAAADQVYVEVGNGTNTTVGPSKAGVKVNAGSVVIDIRNSHASAALTGTLKISFLVIKN